MLLGLPDFAGSQRPDLLVQGADLRPFPRLRGLLALLDEPGRDACGDDADDGNAHHEMTGGQLHGRRRGQPDSPLGYPLGRNGDDTQRWSTGQPERSRPFASVRDVARTAVAGRSQHRVERQASMQLLVPSLVDLSRAAYAALSGPAPR